MSWRRHKGPLVLGGLTFIACAVYFVQDALGLLEGNAWAWASILLTFIIGGTSALWIALAYLRLGVKRGAWSRAWLLVAWSVLLSTLWTIGYNTHSLLVGATPEAFHWTSLPYFSSYLLQSIGIVMLVGVIAPARKARLVSDALLAGSCFAVAAWFLAIQPLWNHTEGSVLDRTITSFYVGLDMILVFGAAALLLAARRGGQPLGAYLLLAAGATLLAVTDIGLVFLEFTGAYSLGSAADAGWIASCGIKGVAGVVALCAGPPKLSATPSDDAAPTGLRVYVGSFAPFAAAMLVAGLALWDEVGTLGYATMATLAPATALAGLAVLRQLVVIVEKQHEIREFSRMLQRKVDERTAHLQARHELQKAVSSTLDPEGVLGVAAEHAARALRADSVRLFAQPDGYGGPGVEPVRAVFGGDVEAMCALPLGTDHPKPHGAAAIPYVLHARISWADMDLGRMMVLRRDEAFTEDDRAMAEAIGLQIGVALSNAFQYHRAVAYANQDYVTGLLNHRAVSRLLLEGYANAEARGAAISLLALDVANFKRFNDVHGHLAGDEVLRLVAQELKKLFGERAGIGRTGGDEFLVVLPGWDLERATQDAAALQDALNSRGYRPSLNANQLPVALNIGVASNDFGCGSSYEMQARADAQLLLAKRTQHTVEAFTRDSDADGAAGGTYSVLDQLVTAIDNLDAYTRQHSEDVTTYALWIGAELACSPETMRAIRMAALLHDVGKICVPAPILRKPGRLTDEEYEVLKQHPVVGALIVRAMPGGAEIVDGVLYHHERYDGSGYPEGLANEQIPFLARLLAVADAVSAMTTHRPYRKGLAWADALRAIRQGIGTQFDPRMAHAFLRAAARERDFRQAA